MASTPPLLTGDQLAARLGVSRRRINQWRAAGRITAAMFLPGGAHGQYLYDPATLRPEALEPDRSRGGRKKKPTAETHA